MGFQRELEDYHSINEKLRSRYFIWGKLEVLLPMWKVLCFRFVLNLSVVRQVMALHKLDDLHLECIIHMGVGAMMSDLVLQVTS